MISAAAEAAPVGDHHVGPNNISMDIMDISTHSNNNLFNGRSLGTPQATEVDHTRDPSLDPSLGPITSLDKRSLR